MKCDFLKCQKAILVAMVQANNPKRIKELMDKSISEGAEAFGIQLEQLENMYKTEEVYKDLFSYANDYPIYITNYRYSKNDGKSDEQLAEELLDIADMGVDLCDIMGDFYDPQPGEMTYDELAVRKQKDLVKKLHEKGTSVIMSSHIFKFTPAEEVYKNALEHQRRGADISKIVVGADNMAQQLENLKIINMLKQKLEIPFLLLSSGECNILRRIGGKLGCCMYLCVCEHDSIATPQQPLLANIKLIRENIN